MGTRHDASKSGIPQSNFWGEWALSPTNIINHIGMQSITSEIFLHHEYLNLSGERGGSLGPNLATPTKPQRPMWPRLFLTGFQFAPLIRSGGKEGDNHATERINFFETSHGDCEHLQMGLDQYITWTFQWMAKKSLHKFKGREGDSERSRQ